MSESPRESDTLESPAERRMYRRFDMTSTRARLARVVTAGPSMELEPCELVNLSQGGMCVQGISGLHENDVEHFLMELTEPFPSLVFVKAEGMWARPEEPDSPKAGFKILESSKGWLGTSESLPATPGPDAQPEQDCLHSTGVLH